MLEIFKEENWIFFAFNSAINILCIARLLLDATNLHLTRRKEWNSKCAHFVTCCKHIFHSLRMHDQASKWCGSVIVPNFKKSPISKICTPRLSFTMVWRLRCYVNQVLTIYHMRFISPHVCLICYARRAARGWFSTQLQDAYLTLDGFLSGHERPAEK